ncbi:MAG: Ppx/GppA phosphatase family protein [Pseudomonadota bacterium]
MAANASAPAAQARAGDDVIAAVDLGSNSFHMVVATLRHGQLTIVDRLRETVRLAEGLTREHGLAVPARTRAISCLKRFGERLREMQAGQVRAAGTNTLRRVSADHSFLKEAEEALGHRIDIIAGVEEARLIYLGVAHSLPPESGSRLVIDIGGGSTELIVGEGLEAGTLQSLGMGCVVHTERFFPDGVLSEAHFEAARVAARLKLRPVKASFRNAGWESAIGASGTIRSTAKVAVAQGLIDPGAALTIEVVDQLIARAIDKNNIDALSLSGLSDRRAQVWPGGLAILVEVMRTLRIDALMPSDGAMREGVLYDLVGRLQHADARVRSVVALSERYHIDSSQALRVKTTALALFEQVTSSITMDPVLAQQTLRWAAQLHEIGLDIAHANFHLHGAYIVGNADLPGFPEAEQQLLAFLLGNQRKRLSDQWVLNQDWRSDARLLTVLLRLAVLMNRSHRDRNTAKVWLEIAPGVVNACFEREWLADNPLTEADLTREREYLADWNIELKIALA